VVDCSISNFDAASVTLKIQRMSLRCVSILSESVAYDIIWHQYCFDVYIRPDIVKAVTYSTHCVVMCITPAIKGAVERFLWSSDLFR
jgi:hypothetical protein